MLYGLRDIGRNLIGLSSHSDKIRKDEFWAVDDVSFEVKRGEVLGIIGPNGSGKTTLLKMLNGIFWPDKGKITVNGKVGALIEVGAGFHPLLTGRENIYINSAILGMSKKETEEKFNDIVDFAGIGDFIDSPVKYYSSGMFVRLGFAVAVHCEPSILLVDEILAVGDVEFRSKCYNRITELMKNCAVVIVSHSMSQISRISNRCMLLYKGKIECLGEPAKVIQFYLSNIETSFNRQRFGNGKVIAYASLDGEKVEHDFTDFNADILLAAIRKQRLSSVILNLSRKYGLSEDECRRKVKHSINVLEAWDIIIQRNKFVVKK